MLQIEDVEATNVNFYSFNQVATWHQLLPINIDVEFRAVYELVNGSLKYYEDRGHCRLWDLRPEEKFRVFLQEVEDPHERCSGSGVFIFPVRPIYHMEFP